MDDLLRHLPLKPVDAMLLLVLAGGERHGYGLVKEVEARSGGSIRLEPGNLYRYVARLVEEGLVRKAARRRTPEAADDRRRYYAITDRGRRVLAAEADRLRTLVREAERALGGATP